MLQLGQLPIIETTPAGESAREGDLFLELKAEVDKLTALQEGLSVDWEKVEQYAVQILREQAKDYSVAMWLVAAVLENKGWEGLQQGFMFLEAIQHNFWSTMHPAPLRIRARRSALEWLAQRLEKRLAQLSDVPEQAWQALSKSWQAVQKEWLQHDPELPEVAFLQKEFDRLGQQARANVQSEKVQQAKSTAAEEELENVPHNASKSTAVVVRDGEQSMVDSPAPSSNQNEQAAIEKLQTMTLTELQECANQALEDVLPWVKRIHELSPSLSWPYLFTRFQAWREVSKTPSHQESITRIPGPSKIWSHRLEHVS